MKLLSSDFWVVTIGATIIATCSMLLYLDFTARLNVAHAQEIGTITFKKRVAQRKYSGQVIWEEVEQRTTLYNNDTIRTADISEAVVKLKDGTEINLDENSMILLSLGDNAININFKQGSIFAKRGKGGTEGVSAINIQSKDATVSLDEKTDVQLSKNKDQELDLTVTGGTAKVTIADKENVVEKNQKLTIDKGAQEAKVVKLQLKPLSPDPNKYFVSNKTATPVQFSWEKVAGNVVLYFEVARDKQFKRKITSRITNKNSVVQQLREGSYYWHIRAINKDTNTVEVSTSRRLTVISDAGLKLTAPKGNNVFTFTTQPPVINFRWSENNLATGYILEIARDPGFASVVKTLNTPLTHVAVAKLGSGKYHWRIKTKVQIGKEGYSSTSNIASFTVRKVENITAPELITPANNRRISSELLKKKQFTLSWRSQTKFKQYRLTIARDKNFKKVITNSVLNVNLFTIQDKLIKNFSVGEYFWKVKPVSEEGIDAPSSQTRRFSIIDAESLVLVAPNNKKVINLKEKQKNTSITFSWKKASIRGNYQFELSKDKGFTTVVNRKLTGNKVLVIPAVKAGKYYWRIRLLDADKSQILVSGLRELNVEKYKKKVVAVVPDMDISADGKDKDKTEVRGKTNLVVTSPVPKSRIYINNRFKGYDKVTVHPVANKKVAIKIIARDYKAYYRNIVLKNDETKTIRAQLIAKRLQRRVKWRRNLLASISSKPVYGKNVIVVSTGTGKLVGLNKYGNILWQRRLGSVSKSTPAVSNNSVYVNTVNEQLYSINLKNGSIKWKKKLEGPLLFGSQPHAVEDRVFVATSHGKVYAFSEEGEELWKRDLTVGIFSSMDHYEDLLFIGTDQSVIYALDMDDGDTDWDFEVDSRIIASSPKVYKDTLYVGCYSGSFYAIEAENGDLKWKFETKQSIFANPAFINDTVYIGSENGNLYAINIDDGKVKWKYKTAGKILSEPDFLNNDLYITSGNSIYSLDKRTGAVKWIERFDGRINTSATVIGKDIFIGLSNGEIVSLRSDLINIVK